jgi:putative tryptophan/tyrosine transport system substrate-binding protein
LKRNTIWLTAVIALGLFLAPDSSHAQAVAKTPRVGILTPAFAPHSGFEAFRQGLRDLGYVEGQNIALEYRYAARKAEPLPALAAELVRLKVDVIRANGWVAARPAQHATETILTVFTGPSDPAGLGLVASLARPGRYSVWPAGGSCTSSVRVNTSSLPGDRHKGKKV